jgi:Domain of unknown function (DUF4124)
MRFAKLVCLTLAAWSVAASSASAIYRCEAEGVITFSDRPCDTSARQYEPDASRISTYDAPDVQASAAHRKQKKPRKPQGPARGSGVNSRAKRAAACDKIRNALKDIRARMRAGYSAREGERLREREQTLRARSRTDKCR